MLELTDNILPEKELSIEIIKIDRCPDKIKPTGNNILYICLCNNIKVINITENTNVKIPKSIVKLELAPVYI